MYDIYRVVQISISGKSWYDLESAVTMAGGNLTDIVDAIDLIQHSFAWRNEDNVRIVTWFSQYLDWLLKSSSGKEEALKFNNQGTLLRASFSNRFILE